VVSAKGAVQPPRSLTIVSQFFDPDPSATAYFISDIAYGLAALGWQVRVITAQPSYVSGLPSCPSEEVKAGVSICRLPLAEYPRARLVRRLFAQLGFTLAAARQFFRDEPPQIVMTVTCPPFLTWLAPAARLRGARFVTLIHDVYPEVVTALGKAPRWLAWGWECIERQALNRANFVVTLGECQRQILRAKLESTAVPVVAIPHWAKDSVAESEPVLRAGHPLLKSLGVEHKFVVQYSGNLGLFHGLEILPQVFGGLSPDVFHVLVVGGGQKRDWLEQQVKALGLEHVTFLPHQPEAELASTLAACDVALVCLNPAAVGLCVPSKLYGSLAVGRAICVVSPGYSESALTVAAHDAGVVAAYDAAAVVSALNAMAKDPLGTAAQGARGRSAYERCYRKEHALAQYASALEAVLAQS
jgi:colanic acid biosynthesis glycosyl transferase WcaI